MASKFFNKETNIYVVDFLDKKRFSLFGKSLIPFFSQFVWFYNFLYDYNSNYRKTNGNDIRSQILCYIWQVGQEAAITCS